MKFLSDAGCPLIQPQGRGCLGSVRTSRLILFPPSNHRPVFCYFDPKVAGKHERYLPRSKPCLRDSALNAVAWSIRYHLDLPRPRLVLECCIGWMRNRYLREDRIQWHPRVNHRVFTPNPMLSMPSLLFPRFSRCLPTPLSRT